MLLLSAQTRAQEIISNDRNEELFIFGKVYSDHGSGSKLLAEVQIEIMPNGERLITGEDGAFSFSWPGEEVWIRFAYPEFSTKEILVKAPGELKVVLFPQEVKSVDQLIPGPFGDKLLYKNSGFSAITGEELRFSGETNLFNALQGRIPGLNVQRLSGMPGEGSTFNLRGISSLFATKQPLIVLDGVPVNSTILDSRIINGNYYNPVSAIDVNDVERVEVYPEGGAMYGLQGNQGLILINTRQPEVVSTKIDFSIFSGITFEPEYRSLLSGTQYKTYLLNQLQNSGLSATEINQQNPWISGNPAYYYYYNYDNDTNWQDEVMDPASVNKVNVTLQGGDEVAKFSVSLGYLNQEGVVKNTDFQRYNFRLNSSLQILKHLSMVANIGFTYHDAALMNTGTDFHLNPISAALLKPPMLAPYLRDNLGNRIALLSDTDSYGFSNPAAIVNNTGSGSFGSNLFAGVALKYQFNEQLDLTSLINLNFNNNKENVFIPDYGIADFAGGEIKNYAKEGITKISGFVSETRLGYNTNIDLRHFLTANAGIRMITSGINYNEGSVFNTPTDEFKSLSSVSSLEDIFIYGSDLKENRSELFLQGDYRFKDRFMAGLVLNLSGSSNVGNEADAIKAFGGNWGFFPSIHAGWLISSEKFLRGARNINMLKLRTSLGYSGNDFYSRYSRYAYLSQPYATNSGIVRQYIPNPSLKWELLRQFNIGLDGAFFEERLQFSGNFFQRNSSDLLSYLQVPAISGYDFLWENNGSLVSTGVDLNLTGRLLYRPKVKITGGVNLTYAKVKLSIPQDIIIDIPGGHVILADGASPFAYYGLKTNGVFSTGDQAEQAGLANSRGIAYQAGDMWFEDKTGDHIIDEKDRTDLGNIFPDLTGGFFLNGSFGSFSLHVLFDFVYGNKLFNYARMQTETFSGYANQSIASFYTWKGQGSETEIPKVVYDDPVGNATFSDRWIEDGSFLRLKEITLAYQLPSTKVYKNLTLYVTGQNLLTLTHYLGYYPAFSYSTDPALRGTDYSQIPVSPSVIVGLKIGL